MRKGFTVILSVVMLLALMTFPAQAATEEEIEDSIEAGIAWLASVQNPDGSWGPAGGDQFGTTGLILVKLQDRAFELGFDGPFDDGYPLKGHVVAGLDFLFLSANTVAISTQTAGDPDTNGNGLGVYVGGRTYDTAILMMAIAAGRDPSRVVATGPLTGWSYGAVLQDLADWMAYAQTDTGDGRGGWAYSAVDGGSWADQSNAGYAMLGLLYAQAPLYGYQCDIPAFVATELDYWIDHIQNDVDGDVYDGGSAYYSGDPDYWVNSLKTGNLLTQMAFVGDTLSVTRVQDALDYIGRHWEGDWEQGWGKSGSVQYQAAYCLMKGFEAMGVPLGGVPGVADWYQDMADAILGEQNVDGSWPAGNPAYIWPGGEIGHRVSAELGTVWALLTLERSAPPPSVIQVTVDVRPMSWPNPLNVKDKGVLPVAILGTTDVDVSRIDPATILLEGVAPLRWALEDVGTPGDPLAGPDGIMDLSLKFDAQAIVAALGAVNDGDEVTLHLTGNLKAGFGGTPIAGQDVVRINKKK